MSSAPQQLAPITIITGGSEGIGKALAFEFAQGGLDLLLVARSQQRLDKTARQISTTHDVKVLTLKCCLADEDSGSKIAAFLKKQNHYCQNLVNNAGFGLAGDFAQHDEAAIRDLVNLNVRALTDLSRQFLPDMLARNGGGILNIASMGGFLPGPYQAAYYASKAYVISLTKALSWETWGTDVQISVLAPGPVKTRFHARMGARSELYVKSGAGISASKAARMGYSGFMCGKCLIIPGILSQLGAVALKIIPHDLLMPFMAWFLRARTQRNPKNGNRS
ncbi:MAG: SDR family oxidoreductase [bacterium]|nr:SDR family oxidoreductase [bacterium]